MYSAGGALTAVFFKYATRRVNAEVGSEGRGVGRLSPVACTRERTGTRGQATVGYDGIHLQTQR